MENSIITLIKENISPKQEDISMISKKYEDICGVLWGEIFQSWSYARKTALRPVNDLDIIKVLSIGETTQDAELVLDKIHKILSNSKDQLKIKSIRKQKSSIGIYYEDTEEWFSIDIVPAIETGHSDKNFNSPIYKVPEIQKMNKARRIMRYNDTSFNNQWILSAPKAYKHYAEKLDGISNDSFRYFTKFIKYWKKWAKSRFNVPNQEFCLKSFHLEQICARIIEAKDTDIINLIKSFFLELQIIVNSPKQFEDFAYIWNLQDKWIDDYIEDPEKNTLEFKQWISNEISRVIPLFSKLEALTDKDKIWETMEQIAGYKTNIPNSTINLNDYKWPHWCA